MTSGPDDTMRASSDTHHLRLNLLFETLTDEEFQAVEPFLSERRWKPGQLILMEAFGGGFTWASTCIRW